jgi:crotonobetainyl-CoA:carnitine CoA-transferase CaiB-like acyl-CoA transferase
MSLAAEKEAAVRLIAATNSAFAQCDGLGALANATAMLLGLVARARGRAGDGATVRTSMLLTAAHANSEVVVRLPATDLAPSAVDRELLGTSALYRLYRAMDGWVFLASPRDAEWPRLADALAPVVDLRADARFADAASRRMHDGDLQVALSSAFRGRAASEWEAALTAAGVGCVEVRRGPVEAVMLGDVMPASGQVVEVEHPMLGAHLRLAPLVSFSRSGVTPRQGCLAGEHTDSVLASLGCTSADIEALRASGAVA